MLAETIAAKEECKHMKCNWEGAVAAFMLGISAMALAGCAPRPEAPSGGGACADGGAPLPQIGLCAQDAAALFAAEAPYPPPGPDVSCSWGVGATLLGDSGDALVYRTATCNGVTTALEASVPAGGTWTIVYTRSALFGDQAVGEPVVTLIDAEGDGRNAILAQALKVAENPQDRANCAVRSAGYVGWPQDAVVVDWTETAKQKAGIVEADGVRSACGPYGLDTGTMSYWRVRQGKAWFYQLGQEQRDFDPASLTLIRKDPAGGWVRAGSQP